jgi:uncharacterized protein with NRDE domain
VLENGVIYGLSNGLLNEFAKVNHGKRRLEKILQQVISKNLNCQDLSEEVLIQECIELLKDSTTFDETDIPARAFDPELEKLLFPICLDYLHLPHTGPYSTRTHTILLVDNDRHATFIEINRYNDQLEPCESIQRFNLDL